MIEMTDAYRREGNARHEFLFVTLPSHAQAGGKIDQQVTSEINDLAAEGWRVAQLANATENRVHVLLAREKGFRF